MTKSLFITAILLSAAVSFLKAPFQSKLKSQGRSYAYDTGFKSMFNGKNFKGWNGETQNIWKIKNGEIWGGSLDQTVDHNYFLITDKTYSNFILKLKIKLIGHEGFINSGIQFRSVKQTDPDYEMIGYQADYGKDYWGTLYDESRRNKTLAGQDPKITEQTIHLNDWNDYELRAEGRRIQIFINNNLITDYTEEDESIPQSGLIGLQIHGGGKALVQFKDILIKELP